MENENNVSGTTSDSIVQQMPPTDSVPAEQPKKAILFLKLLLVLFVS